MKGIWLAMANGYQSTSGIHDVDALLSRGGMDSMLKILWIIIGAVTFGSLMEEFGLLAKLIDPVLRWTNTTARLFVTVVATGMGPKIASPLLSLAYGITGFKITRMPPGAGENDPPAA